jgi:hypothetical protein
MRAGEPRDGRQLAGHPHRPAVAAPALRAVAQGRQLREPGARRLGAGPGQPAAQARYAQPARAAAALHPALGHEPLRGAEVGLAAAPRDPRPGDRRARLHAGRVRAALHWHRDGAVARRRLRRARRAGAFHAARPDGAGHRPEARARPDPRARAGARGGGHRAAVLPAVGRRPGPARRRPRAARRARARLRAAGGSPR